MVAVFGVVGMLSGQRERRNVRPWLAWTLGCAAGVASFAIVSWRADVDSALAWPTATLAGTATAVLVGFSETTTEHERDEAVNPSLLLQDRPSLRLSPTAEVAGTVATLGLAGATLGLHAWQAEASWHHVARVLTGSLYVILVPGWYLSSLFNRSRLDIIERCTLAVILSLVAVPLGLMWIHFLGGRIDFLTTWALVLALAAAAAVLNRLRVLLTASKKEERQSLLQRLMALWESRSLNERAIVLSAFFWLVIMASLTWTVAAPEHAPYGLLR